MNGNNLRRKAADLVRRLGAYKYVLLVLAAGGVLLLWPGEKGEEPAPAAVEGEENFSVASLEEQLEEILSRIDGAGQVSVMLTVQSGMERVLAQDVDLSQEQRSTETVVISTGSGKEEVVLLTQRYPTFQGALVVCDGGENAQVRLLLTQAVTVLTGLGAGRVTVCKGS